MADYDIGIGLLQGLQKGVGGYLEARDKREDREAKAKENRSTGLIKARSEGLIPVYGPDGDIIDYNIDEKMLRLKKPEFGMPVLTKGQEETDKTFGKDYADYQAGGGKSSVDKNVGLLETGIGELKSGKKITGGISGVLPKFAYDVVNPEGASVRDKIEGAIQGTLKQVLGAQYTEAEGRRIFERAFNPRLSDEENAKRAQTELDAIRTMASDKDASARYYEQHGTLAGYKPGGHGLIKSPPPGGKVKVSNGKETLLIDPSDLADAMKDGYQEVRQ